MTSEPNMNAFFWRTPSEPAAIALLSMPAKQGYFDRPLPIPGKSRFALLLAADGAVLDEVVVTRLSEEACEVACHGGPGVREQVSQGLIGHGLTEQQQDPFSEGASWDDLASCVHPAALSSMRITPEHSFWSKRPQVLITGPSNAGKVPSSMHG